MIIAIYSLFKSVSSAWLVLVGVAACFVAFAAVCFVQKRNRSKSGARNTLLFALASEIICDAAWFFIYFPKGEYVNSGLGGSVWLLMLPVLLGVSSVITSAINSKNIKA